MKKTVIKYGLYGLLLSAGLFMMGLEFGGGLDMGIQQIIGYATMIASLCFVFIGNVCPFVKFYKFIRISSV